jgi:hypothetical protein
MWGTEKFTWDTEKFLWDRVNLRSTKGLLHLKIQVLRSVTSHPL